jgi:hypothetical protein
MAMALPVVVRVMEPVATSISATLMEYVSYGEHFTITGVLVTPATNDNDPSLHIPESSAHSLNL